MSDETERREAIEAVHAEGVAAAHSLGDGLSHKADRRDVRRAAVMAACLGAAFAIIVSLVVANQIVDLQAERATEQTKAEIERDRTRAAIASLQEANKKLEERGQQPVPPPADLEPGEAVVAAAAARVLASLPPAPGPTAQQISDAITAYLITNPVTVSPTLIAAQVSAYLAANPPAPGTPGSSGERGEKGDQGDPGTNGVNGTDGVDGRTPTPDEIMAVFTEAAARNPDLLCAGKGKFTEVRGFVRVPPDLVPQEQAFWVCLPQ